MPAEDVRAKGVNPKARKTRLQDDAPPIVGHERQRCGLDEVCLGRGGGGESAEVWRGGQQDLGQLRSAEGGPGEDVYRHCAVHT